MESPSLSLKDNGRIYLDHNATTPPLLSVQQHLVEWSQHWGNPSSIHWNGRGPKNILRESRGALARLLRCQPAELIFTSGGSESNNLVIKGIYEGRRGKARNEYITSRVEHPSVLKSFEYIASQGAVVHYLDVNRDGEIDLDQYEKLLSERTALVSVMMANNETGTLFPIKKMTKKAHAIGALFHTDAVQVLGKMLLDISALEVDFATFSAHKTYALKGVGLVYAKRGPSLTSLIAGGGQERGRRAGTENVMAVAAFGYVAQLIPEILPAKLERMRELRDHMEQEILSHIPGTILTAATSKRLPNTSSLLIDGIDGESLLMNLDLEGVSVSTGAACSSGNPEPSPVLLAMGLSRQEAQRSLRVSLGWDTTAAEVEKFVEILGAIVERLRSYVGELRVN